MIPRVGPFGQIGEGWQKKERSEEETVGAELEDGREAKEGAVFATRSWYCGLDRGRLCLLAATGILLIVNSTQPGKVAGTISDKYNPPRLGERQIGGQRAIVDLVLLQDLAIVGVGGVEPGALHGQTAAPSEQEMHAPFFLRFRQLLLQFFQALVEAAPCPPTTHTGAAGPAGPERTR